MRCFHVFTKLGVMQRSHFVKFVWLFLDLVAVMLWLERTINSHADIIRLLFVQLGKLYADPVKVQTRYFLVQMLGQDVDAGLVFIALGPQFHLSQHLVGE